MKKNITPAALAALSRGDLKNAAVAMAPGGIERQEKEGQIEQSFLETLPKKGFEQSTFEAMGFKLIGDSDDIFLKVQFPKGWRKQATDHSMWSNLLDDKGRKRAAIFYKAAFYDRSAHLHLTQRYSQSSYEDIPGDKENYAVVVKDVDTVIHQLGTRGKLDYKKSDELEAQAVAWLNERFPNWRNPLAYWD